MNTRHASWQSRLLVANDVRSFVGVKHTDPGYTNSVHVLGSGYILQGTCLLNVRYGSTSVRDV